jgi:hypothetical protein
MMNEDVASLYQAMKELSPCQKPSAWQEPISRTGTYPLSKHWKGTYSFLDTAEVSKIRKLSSDEFGDTYFCDKNVDEGKIQVSKSNYHDLYSVSAVGMSHTKLQHNLVPICACNVR